MVLKTYVVENLPDDAIQITEYRTRMSVLKFSNVYFSKSKDRVYQKTPSGYSVRFPNKIGRIILYTDDGKGHAVTYESLKFYIETSLAEKSIEMTTKDE